MVHENHGIGRFVGMVKMQVDGVEKDYIKIAYAGSDALYVPATQLDSGEQVHRRRGGRRRRKKLSKLGGTDWEKAKTRARRPPPRIWPRGLIQLYAQRQQPAGLRLLPGLPVAAGV